MRSLADAAVASGGSLNSSTLGPLQALADKAAATRKEIAALNAEQRRMGGGGGGGIFSGMANGLDEIEGSITSVTGLFGRLAGIIGAGLGVSKLLELNSGAVELAETLEETSKKTGLSTQQLMGLKYAAEQNHVEFGQMQAVLRGLGQTVEEAISKPASKAAEAYQQLGISTQFLKANQNDEMAILLAVADAYQRGGTAIQQMANAQLIMTRGGREIIPVLQQGSSGILAYIQQTAQLAPVSKAAIDALVKEGEAVTDLNTAWEGLKLNTAAAVAPSLTPKLTELSKALSGDSDATWHLVDSLVQAELSVMDFVVSGGQSTGVLNENAGAFNRAAAAADKYAASSRALPGGGIFLPMPPKPQAGPQDAQEGGGARGGFGGSGSKAWPDLPDIAGAKAALDQWVHDLEAATRDRQAALKNDIQAEIALQQKLEDALRSKKGVGSSTLSEAHMRETELWNELTQQQVRASEEASTEQIAIANKTAAAQDATFKAEYAQHKISLDQETADIVAAEDQRFAAVVKTLQDELTVAGLTAAQRTRIDDELTQAILQHQQKIEQATAEAANKSTEAWRSFTGSLESAFSSAVDKVIEGKEHIGKAFLQMTGQLILDFANAVAKMIAQWALFQAATAVAPSSSFAKSLNNPLGGGGIGGAVGSLFGGGGAGGAGGAQQTVLNSNITQLNAHLVTLNATLTGHNAVVTTNTGATTSNTVSTTGNSISTDTNSVSTNAATLSTDANTVSTDTGTIATETASAVSSANFVESIAAFVANTLALIANTAVRVATAAFGTGAWNLENDMLALVHKGEMIVPANDAPFARKLFSDPAGVLGPLQAPAAVADFPALSAANNNGALTAAAAGGGGGNYTMIVQLSAIDTQSGAVFLKQQMPALGRQFAQAHRNGAFSGTPLQGS